LGNNFSSGVFRNSLREVSGHLTHQSERAAISFEANLAPKVLTNQPEEKNTLLFTAVKLREAGKKRN